MFKAFFLIAVLFSPLASGATILKVWPKENLILVGNHSLTFEASQAVCLNQKSVRIGCGTVERMLPKGTLIRLAAKDKSKFNRRRSNEVSVREHVEDLQVAPPPPMLLADAGRRPASDASRASMERVAYGDDLKMNFLSAGFTASLNHGLPTFRYERRSTLRLLYGFEVGTMRVRFPYTNLFIVSTRATVSYYLRPDLKGFWVQGGLGPQFFLSDVDNQVALSATAGGGYRFQLPNDFTLGTSVGAEYITSADNYGISSLNPYACLSVGLAF